MKQAILCLLELPGQEDIEEKIEECINLCEASYIEVILMISQRSRTPDPRSFFRKGKLEEIKNAIEELQPDLLVVYNELSIATTSFLQDYFGLRVLDRKDLILDIFQSRAHTKEAILQTSLARLKYALPARIKESDEERQRGRGAGESVSALIRRQNEKQIREIERQLKDLKTSQLSKQNKRNQSRIGKVCLVGYTNAGKSSLFNTLLAYNGKENGMVSARDRLFETLDTTVRKISYQNYQFLLSDTVGFVSDLPHELIEAFDSTLRSCKDADLLIHLIDASNPHWPMHKETTLSTLKRIGADQIDIIEVFNKCDLLDQKPEGIGISAVKQQGITGLLKQIVDHLYPKEETMELFLPYAQTAKIQPYRPFVSLTVKEETQDGTLFLISGPKETLKEIKKTLFVSN